MQLTRIVLVTWLAAAGAWAADAPGDLGQKPVEFRFNAKPGDVWRTRTSTRTFGSFTILGPLPPQKFSQTWEQDVVMKCLKVNPDGSIVFEMNMPNVAMTMNLGGINVSVDTRQPSPASQPMLETIHRIFKKITLVTCTATFSAQGEPLKVEGLSRGIRDVLDEAKPLLSLPMRKLLDQIRDSLGDQIIEEELRSSFRMIPDGRKARVGDKWVREWQTTMAPFDIATRARGEYELIGIETFRNRPCAKIRLKIAMEDQPRTATSSSPARSSPVRGKFSVKSSGGDGIAYLDYTTGQIMQIRETQRSITEMSIEPQPGARDDSMSEGVGKMTQSITTSIRVDCIDENGETESVSPGSPASKPAS